MFCTNCGLRLETGDKFCARCGTPARLTVVQDVGVDEASAPVADSQREPVPRNLRSTADVVGQSSFRLASSFRAASVGTQSQAGTKPSQAPDREVSPEPVNAALFAEPAPDVPLEANPSTVPLQVRPLPTSYDSLPVAADVSPEKNPVRLLMMGIAVFLIVASGVAIWILQSKTPLSAPSVVATGAHDSGVTVTLTPARADVKVGNGVDFAASVEGTDNPEVVWRVQEGDDGGHMVTRGAQSKGGKLSQVAVYVAPSTPGTYHVTVTSRSDPSARAVAEVNVTPR